MIENSVYIANGIDIGPPLDEEGAFHLRAWPKHKHWASVIVHECDDGESSWMAPLPVMGGVLCPGCEQPIPEKLLAAWFLHIFDEIGAYNG